MGCYPVTPHRAKLELGIEGHLRHELELALIHVQYVLYRERSGDGRGREEEEVRYFIYGADSSVYSWFTVQTCTPVTS
jgi:hypothetical protein